MTASQPARGPEVGDLVVCRDDEWRASLRLPDELTIVIGERKDHARVFFPGIPGDRWIPASKLARVRDPATSSRVPPWMQRIWYLARALDATGIEVERFGEGGNAVRIHHGPVEVEQIDRIRSDLGEELRYYALSPAGLHRIETSIGFVTVDRDPPVPPSPPEP